MVEQNKLSPAFIKAAKPGTYGDGGGLWIRVYKSGRRSWFWQYAVGKQRKAHTFGEYPHTSLREARQRVIKLRADLRDGIDPNDHDPFGYSVSEAVEAHIAEHCSQLKSGRNPARVLRKELSAAHRDLPLTDLGASNIRAILTRIEDRGAPVEAARAFAYLSKFFNWAMRKKGWITSNPMDLIEKPSGNASTRDRVLSDHEVVSVWNSLDNAPGDALIKLLILTGARQGEVCGLTWDDVDLKARTLTFRNTKNGEDRVIPMSDSVFAVINAQPVMGNFVITTSGDRPFSGFSQLTRRVQRDSGTSDWRQHDLRRTCGTGLQKLSVDRETIRAVLGHKHSDGATPVYLRHDFLPEMRDALMRWDQHLRTALAGEQVQLRA